MPPKTPHNTPKKSTREKIYTPSETSSVILWESLRNIEGTTTPKEKPLPTLGSFGKLREICTDIHKSIICTDERREPKGTKPYPLSRTFLREREKQQFLPEPLLLSFY